MALIVGASLLLVHTERAKAGTLTVNTAADNPISQCDDTLSLREAMLIGKGFNALGRPVTSGEKAQISGADFIQAFPPAGCSPFQNYWSITGGVGGQIVDNIVFANNVDTVFPTSGLPNITWAEDIINGLKGDGTKAAISGANAGSVPGLRVLVTVGFTIRNLIIKSFQYEGLLIEGSDNGIIEGLEIYANGRDGIALVPFIDTFDNLNCRGNRVGGTNLSQRNYIYSNGQNGILIRAVPVSDRATDQRNVIENNYIGIRVNDADAGNGLDGIFLDDAFGNLIGGGTAASRNVISGNGGNGILLVGEGCYSNRIVNNFVGTNQAGNGVVPNDQTGIALALGAGDPLGSSSSPNLIGEPGKGNVIGGNFFGVGIFDVGTDHNIVRGNFIGTDLGNNGFTLGNVRDGVYINNAKDNIIGGPGAGEGNVMAYNGGAGVYVDAGTNNAIRGNRIFLNNELGIDLSPPGVTLNDFNDPDTGPNNLQNYPLISGGTSGGFGSTNLSGSVNSTANTALVLDFFVGPTRDPSLYGEGSSYLGSTTVTTNNVGDTGFSIGFNTLNYSGFYATATATDPNGNTSEFSPALRIGCSYSLSSYSQSFTVAGGSGNFNVLTTSACDWLANSSPNSWITITGGASGTGNGTVSFSVAANTGPPRNGSITVGGRIFTITQASNCTYSLVSNVAGYPASGGNDGNSVIASAGCTWMAVSNVPWVTITSGSSGNGNGTFIYSVAANSGPARVGTLTVAGLTYTINQASGCTYALSHTSAGYPASGTNSDGVSVIAGSGCTWMAMSNATWITVTSGSSGTGNGAVLWSVAANTGPARQGTLIVAGLTFTISQSRASVLANISTRLRVETGDNVLIGGFIVTGTEPKKVIVRAVGPSLPVPGRLDNPTLELYGPNGLITSNDDWQNAPNRQEIVDSLIPPSDALESAILTTLPANRAGYTAIVRGVSGGTGIALVEVYDLNRNVDSTLANISSRGFVQTGDNAMIGGFIIVGTTTKKVIVRAIGPSLPVPGKLLDPTVELYDQNGMSIGSNDNWRTGGQEAEIIASTVPPTNDLESAIIATLPPAPHTAIVRGVSNATGVALVEVYALD